jgi:hypothetical protein
LQDNILRAAVAEQKVCPLPVAFDPIHLKNVKATKCFFQPHFLPQHFWQTSDYAYKKWRDAVSSVCVFQLELASATYGEGKNWKKVGAYTPPPPTPPCFFFTFFGHGGAEELLAFHIFSPSIIVTPSPRHTSKQQPSPSRSARWGCAVHAELCFSHSLKAPGFNP